MMAVGPKKGEEEWTLQDLLLFLPDVLRLLEREWTSRVFERGRQRFWRQAYVGALAGGKTSMEAAEYAERALATYESRWGVEDSSEDAAEKH